MAETGFWRSVRGRLLIVALLPMLVLTPLLLGITMQRWVWRTDQILTNRVASDLTVARQYLDHLIGNSRQQVEAFGRSAAFQGAPPPMLAQLFATTRQAAGFDFLVLAPAIARDGPAQADLARLLDRLAPGQSGLAVLSPAMLAALAPDLVGRAGIALVETPGSQPKAATREERALMVLASAPVLRPDGSRALLIGGILLNRNEAFIDRINDLVYPATNPALADRLATGQAEGRDDGLDQGIITLFLGDTRIATTLRPEGGARAVGTRASAAVARQVLQDGRPWRDSALVVKDWYISAYEPLNDIDGARVGMIYAGIPTAPYEQARQLTFLLIGAAFLVSVGIFVPLALAWIRGIFRPVEAMGATIWQVEAGDMAARSGHLGGAEEIVRLSAHLDHLLARLDGRERELRGLNAALNARVEARTADLSRANRALEVTSRQLVLAEKLATIGEVTAGVAHEINNPLAVLSGHMELVKMVLADLAPDAAQELRPELQVIDEQIGRINRLVSQLLQFARPEEFTDSQGTDPAQAIADLRPLVRHMLASGKVSLQEDLGESPAIRMNAHEFQQVLINLIANAVQAMPEGGRIDLALAAEQGDDGQPGMGLRLRDNGPGMDKATQAQVFDPFFTTRGSQGGTGLGLPICLNLITRQGGKLGLASAPGAGCCFTIWLPALAADSPPPSPLAP